MSLSAPLIQAMNTLDGQHAWLWLLDLVVADGPTFYLVNNNADIEFQGRTYTRFPFTVAPPAQSASGELSTARIMVDDVYRVIRAQVQQLNGAAGSTCRVYAVNAGLLAENYADLTLDFDVLSVSAPDTTIIINLGVPNPLRRRFPSDRYIARQCAWKPNSAECGLVGITCGRSLDRCRELNNTPQFGGCPGLAGGGLRLA